MGATHHFGRSVQFFGEKYPASDLDTETATHHFGRSVQFFEEKCSASDLDSRIFCLAVLSKINFHNKISNKYKEFN